MLGAMVGAPQLNFDAPARALPLVPQLNFALVARTVDEIATEPSSPAFTPRPQLTPRDGPKGCMLGPRHDLLGVPDVSSPRLLGEAVSAGLRWSLSPRASGHTPRGRRLRRGSDEDVHPRALLHRAAAGRL
mmetsp:Transcript_3316/g.8291  ORF Transcript_3316/g.8291 Transcript_3316/m.8291 type:complete len:131 (+) Transcript_3316:203-595(+)